MIKKKILFILHYPPPVHGSALIGGLIKESNLVSINFSCRYINLGTSFSVEEIGKNPGRKSLRYLNLIWQVKRALLFFRPDLCYLTISSKGAGFYKDALIVLLVRLFRVKRIYHFHNKGVRINQGKLIDNFLYWRIFKNTDVILLSKHLYPDVQKYVPEDRVHYCPNGILEIKDKRQNEKDKKNGLVPEILFLSHLIKSKGVLVLIDACYLLKERGSHFHCTLAGGDAEMKKEEVAAIVCDKELSDCISVVGPKYDGDKQKLLESADIFVHPSYNDCHPLILLEAMQYSLPLVSTFEGAIPDIVDDGITGFLVPQKDSTALADKLDILIKDRDLQLKMGAAGRAKYEKEFTLEKFENRMTEILKDVASR